MPDARTKLVPGPKGALAREWMGLSLPLSVMESPRGFYLGTYNDAGPISRESVETWATEAAAEKALASNGEGWNQRDHP